jgi:phosphoribosylglycinamide formyltransferase 1
MTARLAVFLSGSGRTLVNLADHIEAGELDAKIAMVIASRPCLGADRAKERGFPVQVIEGNMDARAVERVMKESDSDFAALAGYLKLIGVPECCRERIVNIHPALLPDFGGPGMYGNRVHQAVLDAGCKESGATVHFCDDRYDTGPIIAQSTCPVLEDDTASTLAARVFELEMELYPRVIRILIEGRLRVEDGAVHVIEHADDPDRSEP